MPDGLRPETLDEAYAIQAELNRRGGWPIGALKVGATSELSQQVMNLDAPFAAVVPRPSTFRSGATLDPSSFHHRPLVECEFALRLAVDVDTDATARQDPRELVGAAAPAVELVCSRFEPMFGAGTPSLIADNGVNAAVVLGEPIDAPSDLRDHAVELRCGGEVLAAGTGAQVLGDPYRSLTWSLLHEIRLGRTVTAGTWVITGTCTAPVPCPLDDPVTADFGALGSVAFTMAT